MSRRPGPTVRVAVDRLGERAVGAPAGFLFAEGLLRGRDDLLAIRYCTDVPAEQRYNVVHVHLRRDALRAGQGLFDTTGGVHAAGAFTSDGHALAVREDVGRHNAFDKLLGWALLEGVDLEGALACVSGRASYELLQKAVAGRLTVFAAVSAPSSLAIDVARRFDVTLAGFVRGGGCTLYAGAARVVGVPDGASERPNETGALVGAADVLD